jgi:purine-binding chemotaxis protein CheW
MNAAAQTLGQPVAAKPVDDAAQYLTFLAGGEPFAIGILGIKEIIEYAGLTEVPLMPSCIRGVINVRGAVVPVLDLAVRFGRQPTAITRRTCIVIVEVASGDERHDMGILVDAVSAVLEIPLAEIEPPPAFGARIRTDFIAGMGKVDGRFVILLEIDKVLSVDEIGELARAGADAGAEAGGAAP